jgi:FdhD protein
MKPAAIKEIEALDVERSVTAKKSDRVVVEEPLEIRISDETLAVTMRTPGHDRELVLGFLLAEGVIANAKDVSSIVHCAKPDMDEDTRMNTIEVTLAPGVRPPIDDDTGMLTTRRGTLTTSACGVCGRKSIDDLLEDRGEPLALTTKAVTPSILREAVNGLRAEQPIFKETGGCHAASLVTFDGKRLVTYEDVGRHNAVDKVIGSRVLQNEIPLGPEHILAVSGRASFEIIQKAFAARIPIVASVSAPSSLAISLAKRTNITLAGFVRDEKMTVYTAADRIDRT